MRLAADAAIATVASNVHPRPMHVTPFRLGRKRASAPIEELVAAADEPDVEPASGQGGQGEPTLPAGPAAEATVKSRELQDEGNALAESRGDFSGALQLWLRALALTPHRPELHETLVRHSARQRSTALLLSAA